MSGGVGATSFNFTSQQPKQQLFTDVQNINAFNDAQIVQFIDIAIAFLHRAPNADELLNTFSQTHGVNPKALKTTLKGIVQILSSSLQKNLSSTAVKSDFEKLGLQQQKAAKLSEKWQSAFVSLSKDMIAHTLVVNQLLDIEWKFGVTAASDSTAQVGSCFLQLKLVIDKGNEKQNVLMDADSANAVPDPQQVA